MFCVKIRCIGGFNMKNPVILVVLFYVLGVSALVTSMFFVSIVAGLVALGLSLLVPAVVLYLELKEGE